MDAIATSSWALIGYLAPLGLILSAVIAYFKPASAVDKVFQIGRAAAALAFLFSLAGGAAVFLWGPLVTPTIGFGEIGLSLRLDALSVIMVWLVSLLGLMLIQFSRNYLDGDARHTRFMAALYLTAGAVIFFVLSGNLWQLTFGWVFMSLALHQLLTFYKERRRAMNAARKKFVVARLGDVLFIIAAVLIGRAFGTADLGALSQAASEAFETGVVPAGVGTAAVLIALAAALKSAMFPTHGWLLEVMETPTPVSALLHAGLLNAGTFLVVRLGDLVFLSTAALTVLIVIGGFTAIFASSAMITQSSVKVSLAYSSAAHMGFMLMLCGFGAHSVAIMHLVAHSFYKAHAFLSSGSIVEYMQNTGSQKLNTPPRPWLLLTNLGVSLLIFVAIGTALGIELTKRPGETALGAIFVIAVAHLLVKGSAGISQFYVIGRTALAAVGVTLAFFALELTAAFLLGNSVAVFPEPNTFTIGVMIAAVIAFGIVTMLGSLLPSFAHKPAWRAFYVHLKNGFYANAWFDRLLKIS